MKRRLFAYCASHATATLMACAVTARADDRPPNSTPGYSDPVAQKPAPEDHEHIDNSPSGHDGHPLAGYHNGLFFLRDHHDNYHLYIQGRSQVDWYSYLGAGAPLSVLKPTLFVRRVRPEFTGEFLGHWRFFLAGDFGATALDNPRGTNETSAAAPGVAPTAGTARYATAQTVRFSAQATDVYMNYRAIPAFNVQIGQFDVPFTLENRTPDKWTPFMERSMTVRAVGAPTNKDLGGMLWGETPDRLLYYSAGMFMGDGMNRPNVDNRFDFYGRAFVHPLAKTTRLDKSNPIRDFQIGFSLHYGSRDRRFVDYDAPSLSTQGNWTYWAPTYNASTGVMHIIPSGDQLAVAAEARLPYGRFDATAEVVSISNGTREALDGLEATDFERFGSIKGYSYYAMLGFWAFGPRDIQGVPGYEYPARLDWSKTDPVDAPQALQLLVKWEQVALTYRSASRSGVADTKNVDGDIRANAFSLGANFWASRHVRLSVNYVYNAFPDSAPVKATATGGPVQSGANRAVAPGNTLAAGADDYARDNAHAVHEILARVAIGL